LNDEVLLKNGTSSERPDILITKERGFLRPILRLIVTAHLAAETTALYGGFLFMHWENVF